MSRARFVLAGLVQFLVGAGAVQGSMVLFRFVLHPALVSALALDVSAASATRRLGVFAAVMGSYWAFVRWYERRPVGELRVEWRWILGGAFAGALSIAAPIALLYASGHYQVTAVRGLGGVGDVLFVILVAAVIEERSSSPGCRSPGRRGGVGRPRSSASIWAPYHWPWINRLEMVDQTGIEPVTSSMPLMRAPNCATGPLREEIYSSVPAAPRFNPANFG